MAKAQNEITIKSPIYKVDRHDEFVRELKVGDIICTYFTDSPKLYHAGIYCGPRKDAHPVLLEFLKPGIDISCPECSQDLVTSDCGHNVHIVADLTMTDRGAGGSSGSFASSRKRGIASRSKYGLSVLKDFMKGSGAFKFNFHDKRGGRPKKDKKGKNPLPVDDILKRALGAVTNPKYRKEYDLLSFNCEHFASWCRYGEKSSLQAKKLTIAAAIGVVAAAAAGFITVKLVRGAGGEKPPEKKQKAE